MQSWKLIYQEDREKSINARLSICNRLKYCQGYVYIQSIAIFWHEFHGMLLERSWICKYNHCSLATY